MKFILSALIVISTTVPSISNDDIPLTRDITGTPYRSYEETRGDYNYGDIYICKEQYNSNFKGTKDLVLYINVDLYPDIQSKLIGDYVNYMEGTNWTVVIKTITGGDEIDLRNTMAADFVDLGYFYAIFIGDLPVAWFDVDNDSEGEFPCDLFYMDLDGEWRDDVGSDGVFDYHEDGSGDVEADIPMGRWTVSPLTFGSNTEKSLIEHYIDKNLDYRQGYMVHDEGGLAYVDDDWASWATEWGNAVSCAFSNVLTLGGSYVYEDDYEDVRLPTSYEHMLVCVHSGYYVHTWDGSWSYPTYNTELYDIESHSITYNMFACSNTRFTEANYMGGWYTFMDNDWGVLSIGSTKSGSMLNFEDFYQPLGCGKTYGESFREWFEINAEVGMGSDSRGWFYGMSVNGDPTLKTMEYLLPVKLSYFTGMPTSDGVKLSWGYSDDGEEVGFNIYRRVIASDAKKDNRSGKNDELQLNSGLIVGASPLTYSDDDVTSDTEYEYRLEMVVNSSVKEEATAYAQTSPPTKTSFGLTGIFPNPAGDTVSFEYAIPENSTGNISIYDLSGRKVYSTEVIDNQGIININTDDGSFTALSNGLYIVRLTAEDKAAVKKFVIAR